MELKFDSEWELKALHRVLFEAKYNNSPNDYDVQGSPFSKSLCDKVFALIIEKSNENEIVSWNQWRQLESHLERLDNLKNRLINIHSSHWLPLSTEDRIEYIHNLVSPLVAGDNLVQELVDFANNVHKGN
jgi:hypothetical protein